jgi:hypothetical protein
MDSKLNGILIGVIMILIGLVSFLPGFSRVGPGYLTLTGAGFALLLLYKTKKKSWSLILGSYSIVFGFLGLISRITGASGGAFHMIGVGMLFIIPAMIYLVLFYDKNKQGLLVPGCLLLWLGIYVSSFTFVWFARFSGAMFFIYTGCALFTVYLLDGHSRRDGSRRFGIILAIFGATLLVVSLLGGMFPLIRLSGYIKWLVIAVGVIIIIKALKKRR